MHDQWEYKLLSAHGLKQSLKDGDGVEYGELSEELLNRLGREGWEVCSHNCSCVSPHRLVLKRRIPLARTRQPVSARRRQGRAPLA